MRINYDTQPFIDAGWTYHHCGGRTDGWWTHPEYHGNYTTYKLVKLLQVEGNAVK